mgnify:CR=1 FL=1
MTVINFLHTARVGMSTRSVMLLRKHGVNYNR